MEHLVRVQNERDRRALAWLRGHVGDGPIEAAAQRYGGPTKPYLSTLCRMLGVTVPQFTAPRRHVASATDSNRSDAVICCPDASDRTEGDADGEINMLRWIVNWAARYAPTVEQQAQKALPELRLELFQAEQRILDAQVHADYYCARLAFCESVLKNGIEQVSDKRKDPETAVATLRSGPKLTAAQSA